MSDEAIFKVIYSAGKDFDRYESKAVKEMLSLLNQARKDVIDVIASTESNYALYVNQNAKVRLEQAIKKLEINLKGKQLSFLDNAWELGIEQVDTPFRVLGVAGSFDSFVLDETMLRKLKDFSATLITNLTTEALPKIDSAIKIGMLKGDNFITIARQVGKNLTDPSIFKSVSERAIVIAQTEMGRVYNTANNERMKQVKGYVPGLMKMWSTAGDANVRPSHQRLNGQVVEPEGKFQDSLTGVSIDRPGDPAAPASFTIRCRCRAIPFKENWDIDWPKHGYNPYQQAKGKAKQLIFK